MGLWGLEGVWLVELVWWDRVLFYCNRCIWCRHLIWSMWYFSVVQACGPVIYICYIAVECITLCTDGGCRGAYLCVGVRGMGWVLLPTLMARSA